ncbi:MAG TPA: type II CAAX endopeptidase family protein [Dehalococcoidia bacterium]|nr:type II CAAX endopeptidase family protein [Dehalococcoidia bacterium]
MQQSRYFPSPFSAAPPAPERAPWGIQDIFKAIGILIIAAVVLIVPAAIIAAAIAGSSDAVDDDPDALAVLLGANALIEVCLLFVAYRFSVRKYRISWRALGFRWPFRGGFWLPIFVLIASYITLAVYAGILYAVGADDLLPESTLPDTAFDSPAVTIITAILAVALAPVMEETFFRGFVFGSLKDRWGIILAALASGVLFALVHFDPGSMIPFTIIGMIFAFSYVYSGSLFVPIAAHFIFNTVSTIATIAGA